MLVRLLTALLCSLALLGSQLVRLTSEPQVHAFHDLIVPGQAAQPYSPEQVERAYGFSPMYKQNIDGFGQTVALIEIDSFNTNDLTLFDTTYGLAAPSIQEFYAGGQPFQLGNQGETTYDLEWLHALAPGAEIQVYYVDSGHSLPIQWQSMASALTMAAANGAGIVSISLGACRPGRSSLATQAALSALFHQGVSAFISSGDDGDHPGPVQDCGNSLGVAYPGGDPFAVSVGGTSLRLRPSGAIASETAWKWSGGGRVAQLSRRPWQIAPSIPSDRRRWAPDVAFLGNPHTGVRYMWNGSWRQAGGTSLGAPAWAAAWALVQQDAGSSIGPAARMMYRIGNSPAYATAFHDITTGSNGAYHAGVGWDAVTGWGTPNVAALAAAVVADTSAPRLAR